MKVKMDFVTNSSSTSFCCWGVCLYKADIIENTDFMNQLKMNNDELKDSDIDEYVESVDLPEEVMVFFNKKNLDVNFSDGYYYIGMSPQNIPDEMTMGEMKKNVKKIFDDVGMVSERCDWIEETIYN